MIIESIHNKIIKNAIALKNKKEREKNSLFIAEGERLVSELNGFIIKHYILSESYRNKVNISLLKDVPVYITTDNVFEKLSDTVNPQGILAVCEQKKYNKENILNIINPFFLLAENLNDPGNMGTIIRTADAMGIDAIFLSKGCVDIYNPKVIRATMGSAFHIPIITDCDFNELLLILSAKNIPVTATHLKGDKYPSQMDFSKTAAILIGNEANGITDKITQMADNLVKIPMLGKAESLNVAIACSIMLYEVTRQRLE